MGRTKISWAEMVWNPTTGCTKVSAGCAHCYAERWSKRFRKSFRFQLNPKAIDLPLHWKKPRRIFVNSMSDLFHPEVPDHFIANVYSIMETCQGRHTFLVLTKRPERMRQWLTQWKEKIDYMADAPAPDGGLYMQRYGHIWHGVSVENQETADERIPILLDTPAAHRFVSAEPLLGPVDLSPRLRVDGNGYTRDGYQHTLGWVIVGGESGPGARPCDIEWIRSIVGQCRDAEVPCFVKQIHLEGKCVRDMEWWDADLRVQQFPEEMTCPR